VERRARIDRDLGPIRDVLSGQSGTGEPLPSLEVLQEPLYDFTGRAALPPFDR